MQSKTIQYLSIAFFAALLLVGGYVTLIYLGMPIHGAVLLTEAGEKTVAAACGNSGDAAGTMELLCRGAVSMFPFLIRTLGRAGPFLWYGLLSLVLYGGYLAWRLFREGNMTLPGKRKPWHVFLLVLFSLWLLFTTLSFGNDGNGRPVRSHVEPSARTYNVSEQGLVALLEDYRILLDRGCLPEVGATATGERVHMLSARCIQTSFITRVMPQVLFVTVLLFELLVLGRFLLGLLRIRPNRMITEAILSVALGACGWIAVLWTLAVAGIFTGPVGWVLVVGIPLACYKDSHYWLDRFLHHEWESDVRWYDVRVLLAWLLFSYIALNFLSVVRPFPIGWDDLGSYLNRPRLLVSYGQFIHSMAPFDWSYLTATGFLLFGYQSIMGATASMMVNWAAGLLALAGVYAIANAYLGRRHGLLAALLYYSLPLVGHFSFADMKIDNAVFFMGSMATFALFLGLFPVDDQPGLATDDPASGVLPASGQWKYMALAGVLAGFAFAFKVTGIMVILTLCAVLAGVLLHWWAAAGAVLFSGLVFAKAGGRDLDVIITRFADLATPSEQAVTVFLIVSSLLGAVCFAYAFYLRRKNLRPFLVSAACFVAGILVAVLPWIAHNNWLAGNFPPSLALGAPNNLSPIISMGAAEPSKYDQDVRGLPPDLQPDMKHPACTSTGGTEELDRYWGFSSGWRHFVTLPWRTVMNVDSVGYYVTTMPALLLVPLVLLLPYFWIRRGRWLRWTFFSAIFLVFQWTFLANGIPWYGIGMFLGLVLCLEAMAAKAPDVFSRSVAVTLITVSLFSSFAMRFWQFEQQRNILEYGFGKISAGTLEELTIPHYNGIKDEVLRRQEVYGPGRPYLYRVGTFISYFIPKNLESIGLSDHQLDTFNCLYQERDGQITLRRLKTLGFNSIIFDTNTATIEKDLNGTLHKKVKLFQDFVNTPGLGLEVLINDTAAGVAFIGIP